MLNLFPHYCIFCANKGSSNLDLCAACEQQLPWLTHSCSQCSQQLASSEKNSSICGKCLNQNPAWAFDRSIALFSYEEPIIPLITAIKFQSRLVYSQLLAKLLLRRWRDFYGEQQPPDCIIPMPLHPQRIRERGFNQALELAKPLAQFSKIPLLRQHCVRNKATIPQSSLGDAKQRQNNVANAFIVPAKPARHVAIIDDVVTTGATVNALSTALRSSGVEQIDVWCCARTQLKR